ncbi:LysR family transcriptional regulator [Klebsiella quasipneumoniae]|uniref:LysR family transcriptional regulator n=1 Tax=Klebsiella quasipneumoniae TaxID=1463165 RepID=UPI0010EDC8BC|nr:LysR family transcriptional regulator [Klebsiella quasipneumoniae]HBR1381496.1 LysR family transcriptional regulator [Klebsiella quasipneumoniae subsp. similipneumoniae]MCC7950128.1 LysR family transcriptional regulator [Klebsiella quasipneumoniae]MCJ7350153.1 LysR family transcriptional regulator [Klebsiella quasipneumoniae]VTM43855.1 LysR family transcriptional regulator [Klebsiella quasipneumoniae]HBW2224910.1 LysR family transcriptional regulator [Klebsiella quasipneumoniae subsp. simil
MKTLPDLQQIEILILIVKHGSFRQAARALNLSPPALTSAINHLEEKLGVRLLNRSTRSLSLTAVGEEFLNNMTPVMNDYRRVVDSLNYHRLTPEGVVKVNLPRIVLDLFFQRYFIAFKTAYPDVTLELFTTDRKVNIIESGFDAGIRYSRDVPKDMIAIPFGEKLSLIPVASPDYLRQAGAPDTPQSLINFRCVNRCFPSGEKYRWEFISPDGEPGEVAVKGDLVVDSDTAMIQAAESGLGIAFVYQSLVSAQLNAGSLIRLLPSYRYPADHFCVYYPSRKHIPAPLRAFITWVMAQNKSILHE